MSVTMETSYSKVVRRRCFGAKSETDQSPMDVLDDSPIFLSTEDDNAPLFADEDELESNHDTDSVPGGNDNMEDEEDILGTEEIEQEDHDELTDSLTRNHEWEESHSNSPEAPDRSIATESDQDATNATPERTGTIKEKDTVHSFGLSHDELDATPEQDTEPYETPDLADILASTDALYDMVTDKATVTVKDIMKSLKAEFQCKFDKQVKLAVRERLVQLVNNSPTQNQANESENEVDSVGANEDDFSYEEEDVDVDDDANEGLTQSSRARRKSAAHAAKLKVAAARIRTAQQRKKRLEELKVRNEELQIHRSQEDQKRAELIAAKFDTNTEELRLARMEQRIDLIQKLGQKRSQVLIQSEETLACLLKKKALSRHEESTDSEESESEEELELVGQNKQFGVKKGPLDVLDLVGAPKRSLIMSPGRVRAALRNRLAAKRIRKGNQWLARELSHKNEDELLKECLEAEQKKRTMYLKSEQVRLQANDRKQLRDRMLLEQDQENIMYEEEDPDDSEYSVEEEEQDEEEAMVLEIEHEKIASSTSDLSNEQKKSSEMVTDDYPDVESISHPKPDDRTDLTKGHESSLPTGAPKTDDSNVTAAHVEIHDKAILFYASDCDDAQVESTRGGFNDDGPDQSAERIDQVDVATDDDNDIIYNTHDDGSETSVERNGVQGPIDATKPKGPRNSAWHAMLLKEKELALKNKKKKAHGLVEEEADEEEEEEVAGLEDFGFKVIKKKEGNEDDDDVDADEINEDDLEGVVDDVSDDEGDEVEGDEARKAMEAQEEKERHKEIMRRMREGYDGRRGGVAGGAGARGNLRFDQLVAADNREDAKRLGLANDDELESDDEDKKEDEPDEEEDEHVLLDKILKDRFLHRSSNEEEPEQFSDDEDPEDEDAPATDENEEGNREDQEQERLAKRFAKRARMQRLIEKHGDEEEFAESQLIKEDITLREELQKMKNGLVHKRSQATFSCSSFSGTVDRLDSKRIKTTGTSYFASTGGSLAIALQASRKGKNRTTFIRNTTNASGSFESSVSSQAKSISFSHVVFHTESQTGSKLSRLGTSTAASMPARKPFQAKPQVSKTSLWSKAVKGGGFQRRRP